MKTLQTPRYRWLFYAENDADNVDDFGEPVVSHTFITSGLFAYERAKRPLEISDAGQTVSETQYVLIGDYIKYHHDNIAVQHFAWCPQLDKVVEVFAEPIDDTGEQRKLVIYVVDNVQRTVDTGSLPLS